MAKYKVLYTDNGTADMEIEKSVLAAVEADLVLAGSTDEATLVREGMDCVGILVEYAKITENIIKAWAEGGNVKCISRQGIGYNNIDVEAASKYGIAVANVPDYCLDEVADHTLTLALSVLREIKSFGKRIAQKVFAEKPIRPIYRMRGRNYCLYGFGNIARQVALRAQAFGFQTFTFDPFVTDEILVEYKTARVPSLDELAEIADVFSVHAPLLPSTYHTVNMHLFERMKKNCVVVNTSRGPLLKESDLIAAIDTDLIAGAGLDVFAEEPPDFKNPLLHRDNIICTPHVAFYSEEAEKELRMKIAANIVQTIKTGEPCYCVNRQALKR